MPDPFERVLDPGAVVPAAHRQQLVLLVDEGVLVVVEGGKPLSVRRSIAATLSDHPMPAMPAPACVE